MSSERGQNRYKDALFAKYLCLIHKDKRKNTNFTDFILKYNFFYILKN